jgi:hypothetical protein
MIDRLPFIEHPQTLTAFERLNAIVYLKGLGVMEATRATGKTRIVEEFITNKLTGIASDRAVYVNLHKTYRKTLRSEDHERIGSPITLWLFDQLHYVLQRLVLPVHSGQKKLIHVPETRNHTERAFSVLYRKVLQGMQMQRIRLIVIDNAHNLDAISLEWLLALRETIKPLIAIIFCAQLQEAEKSSHTLNLALSNVPSANDSLVDRFQLAELSFDDFENTVLESFLDALQLDLDRSYTDDTQQAATLIETIWSWSKGNWVLLDWVGRQLLAEYDGKQPPYQLTPEIIERVRRKRSRVRDSEPDVI